MQSIERPTYCQPCQKPTNHQIQYRSDPDFVGRVLVCENCGPRIPEPLGSGTCCRDCWQAYKPCGSLTSVNVQPRATKKTHETMARRENLSDRVSYPSLGHVVPRTRKSADSQEQSNWCHTDNT